MLKIKIILYSILCFIHIDYTFFLNIAQNMYRIAIYVRILRISET